jgi:hypothetical protein
MNEIVDEVRSRYTNEQRAAASSAARMEMECKLRQLTVVLDEHQLAACPRYNCCCGKLTLPHPKEAGGGGSSGVDGLSPLEGVVLPFTEMIRGNRRFACDLSGRVFITAGDSICTLAMPRISICYALRRFHMSGKAHGMLSSPRHSGALVSSWYLCKESCKAFLWPCRFQCYLYVGEHQRFPSVALAMNKQVGGRRTHGNRGLCALSIMSGCTSVCPFCFHRWPWNHGFLHAKWRAHSGFRWAVHDGVISQDIQSNHV